MTLLFLMTDFNLPCKASQEARSTSIEGSRPILVVAAISNYPANHEEFCKPYSAELTTQKSQEGSNRGSLRAIHLC